MCDSNADSSSPVTSDDVETEEDAEEHGTSDAIGGVLVVPTSPSGNLFTTLTTTTLLSVVTVSESPKSSSTTPTRT